MRQTLLFSIALLLTLQSYCQTQEEQAFKVLNDSLQKYPKNSNLLFMRGLTLGETKKYDSAIADFTSALENLKLKNNKPIFRDVTPAGREDILTARAYCYDMINAVEKSIADYRSLQASKPGDFMYSIAVARIYIKHKDFEKAQSEIDHLKKLPENERGLVYQAILFYEMDRNNEALNAVNAVLKKYPNSIEGLITKAKIFGKLGQTEEACKNASEAKTKITLDYFGGQQGYQWDYEQDIDNLKKLYCK